ncbi:HNH endonuclease [Aestuariibacter sp. AA17]|uniref:HNH endonuclease n=1 Tax=Fluctibacter corallii TaxID=2984329 RepID=A0ABT3ADS5_9ALTE|nr:HNH endonuclease [Aestuariibacter sp. AA17]MCV2886462.1 HNH endonuclease [Aestuariibacter sp. AA17]
MYILKLNQSAQPVEWISVEEACRQYCLGNVMFELGQSKKLLLGGTNKEGEQSRLNIASIIGCRGKVTRNVGYIPLRNRWLFARDDHTCLYCGRRFKSGQLTMDHIIPRSRGGRKNWTNAATACKRCNVIKGARTPEEAGMALIAVPFKPNQYEQLFLRNHRILPDQVDYLCGQFSPRRNWLRRGIDTPSMLTENQQQIA